MKRLLLFIICACLCACATQVPLTNTSDTNRVEREIIRDTTVIVKADEAQVRALLECDSLNRVIVRELEQAQGERIKPTVTRAPVQTDAGALLLTVDCKEDSLQYEVQIRDRYIEQLKSTHTEVAVKYIPDYYRNTSAGFWVLLAIIICAVAIRVVIWYFKRK